MRKGSGKGLGKVWAGFRKVQAKVWGRFSEGSARVQERFRERFEQGLGSVWGKDLGKAHTGFR